MGEWKDKLQGKAEEFKGEATDDKPEEMKGEARQAWGGVQGKVNDARNEAKSSKDESTNTTDTV